MATKKVWVKGICKYAKVYPENMDTAFNDEKYTINVYPENIKSLKESGFRGKIREDEDGTFVKLSRKHKQMFPDGEKVFGPPKVWDKDGQSFHEPIGNGSRVAVLIEVYGSAYGTGSRIKEVHVLEHIPYTPGDSDGPSVVPVD